MPRADSGPCLGKEIHDSKKQAEEALHARVRRGASGYALHAYRCHKCKKFHVGHYSEFQKHRKGKRRQG
jgi:uncharacterized UBP type Zn finger protein